jgi:proline iminopeptidase
MQQSPETFTIPSGNDSLAVKCYDSARGETVLLLHGGPGVPDEMTEVREILSRKYRVITFDQRGTGSGDHSRCTYGLSDYLDDINNLASFFQQEKFHIFGHSWGGLYAQLYARSFPEKILSLFLCSPASGCGRAIWKLTEHEVMHYNRTRSTASEWLAMGMNSVLGQLGSDRACQRLFRQVIINYHRGFDVAPPDPEKLAKINAAAVNKTRKFILAEEPLRPFGHTTYPVIITYGDQDAYGKSREFVSARFPDARYETIPQCGHTPWKHNLPQFERLLTSFYTL